MSIKTSIYSVDIYVAKLIGINNEVLARQILDNHKEGNLSKISYESDRANNEEDSTLPETQESSILVEQIIQRVVEVIKEHYPKKKYKINFSPVLNGKRMIWSHVIFPNESTGYHAHRCKEDHDFLNLSCVYYVKTHPNCGRIKFNPLTHNNSTWSIEPEVGMLVIFPSWLPHYTLRNLSNQTRISISANFDIIEEEN